MATKKNIPTGADFEKFCKEIKSTVGEASTEVLAAWYAERKKKKSGKGK